jgi:hypothetical protein
LTNNSDLRDERAPRGKKKGKEKEKEKEREKKTKVLRKGENEEE